jgi:hypothetical protein
MNEMLVYGLIIVAVLAVLGLGVKISISYRSGDKTVIRDVNSHGDVVGRDKIEK